MRRDFVSLEFTDKALKDNFNLSGRYAEFAREYALCGNAKTAALFAGFAKKTAEKNGMRIARKCAPAVDAIRAALIEKGNSYKIALQEHLTAAMLDIVDNRSEAPGPAVMACRVLSEMYKLDNVARLSRAQEIHAPEVSPEEIEAELKKMGIYELEDEPGTAE